jgi:hypothetical protein
MTTAKQLAANRRNAKNSTGPRTDEGKAQSSQNALKHGLSAERAVIWDEDPAEFEALRSALFDYYQPTNPIDEFDVGHLAESIWKRRRVAEIEAGIYAHFSKAMEGPPSLQRLLASTSETDDDEDDEDAERARTRKVSAATKGAVFEKAERPLTSLYRLAGSLEGSIFRTRRKLECRKAERAETTNGYAVIDVEPEQEKVITRPRPRLRDPVAAESGSDGTDE